MTKQPCKPWKSYEQQIKLLKSHGMIFENEREAQKYISQVNYYRLSGYWYPFRKIINQNVRADEFIVKTKFEDVLALYEFDKKLRFLCLEALEVIEMSIRTQIAYILGRTSATAHLDIKNFDKRFTKKVIKKHNKEEKTAYEKWLERFDEQLKRANKNPAIQHHLNHYQNIPIWVAIDYLDFGTVSVLYWGLPTKQREQIAREYNVQNSDIFASWLRSLNYIRNICAHHSRLWNVNIDVIAKQDEEIVKLQSLDNKRLFFYLVMIIHLLEVNNYSQEWEEKLKKLLIEFPIPSNNAVKLNGLGFINGII